MPYFCKDQPERYFSPATPVDNSKVVSHKQALARKHKFVLPESSLEKHSSASCNALIVVDADESVISHYRKVIFRTVPTITRHTISRRETLVSRFLRRDTPRLAWQSAGTSGLRRLPGHWHYTELSCCSIRLQAAASLSPLSTAEITGGGRCKGIWRPICCPSSRQTESDRRQAKPAQWASMGPHPLPIAPAQSWSRRVWAKGKPGCAISSCNRSPRTGRAGAFSAIGDLNRMIP